MDVGDRKLYYCCSNMEGMIQLGSCGVQAMQFWRKAERVVQYKQQVVTNARKKEVMDKHLDFLVGQTQRYSTLLAQRLAGMLPLALSAVLLASFSPHRCLNVQTVACARHLRRSRQCSASLADFNSHTGVQPG